jgi:DNA-binding SARP family transcriptional activator
MVALKPRALFSPLPPSGLQPGRRDAEALRSLEGRWHRATWSVGVTPQPAGTGDATTQPEHEGRESWLRLEQAPVIGREAELTSLSAALERALVGRGGVCLIRGEAGVGKTRLAEEALARVSGSGSPISGTDGASPDTRGALVLRGKATERETPLTYEGITGVLRYIRRRCGMLSLERCSERLAPYRSALAALLPEWRSEEIEPGGLGDKYFVFEAVSELLRELVAQQPVCLFLDDAQWMDQNSLELLQYLMEGLAEEPLALLLGVRDEEPNPWLDALLAELRRRGRFNMWILRRLGREATIALAEAWLEVPSGSLDPELADYLCRETAGNSFFLQEVISGLLETGALERSDDRFTCHTGSIPVVTGGMLSQVEQRIQRLEATDRAVLAAASALGEATELRILRAVTHGVTGGSMDRLSRALEQLKRRHFLVPDDRHSEGGLGFSHPKVRQAVYHSLSADERMRWHREAARVLRALPTSHPAHSGADIGYHLSMAEEAQEALPYLLKTASQMLGALSFGDAAWNLQRAERHLEQLALAEPDHWVNRHEGHLWLLRGHLYYAQGRSRQSTEAFLRAWECVKDLPTEVEPELKATIALFRGHGLLLRGDLDQSEAWLAEQRPLLEEALGAEDLLYLHYNLARIYGDRREWARRKAVLREGQQLAQTIDSEGHVGELARRLHVDAGLREDSGQAELLQQLLKSRASTDPHPLTLFRWHWFECHAARRRGDWEAARAAGGAMLALADRHRHQPYQSEASSHLLTLRALTEPAATLPDLQAEVRAATEAQDSQRHGRALAALTAASAEVGAWAEAAGAAQALLAFSETMVAEPQRHGWTRQALLTLAEAALAQGRVDEARAWLERCASDGTPPNEFWTEEEALVLHVWLHAAEGDPTASETLTVAREAVAACADVRLRAIMQAQLAHAALQLDQVVARELLDAARPTLQACGSFNRLHALEERLTNHGAMARQPGGAVSPGEATSPVPTLTLSPSHPLTPSARLQVRLLGGFECAVNGRTVAPEAWGSRKARNLFKYLLLRRGRPLLAGDLLEEFWPDLPEDGARHALRSTLHRIRRALEPERPARAPSAFLQVADDTVCLSVGPETAVDLFEFEDRLGQARRREAHEDAGEAQRLRQEAVALYAGDLLPQDLNETWALGPREGLREQYLSTLARLAEAALDRDEPAAALPFAERMLETDSTHEPAIRALVCALAALGRETEAVRRYDLFAQQLDRDLGLIPERETRELVERLRRGR